MVGAQPIALSHIVVLVGGRKHRDRDAVERLVLLDHLKYLETGFFRHLEVEQDEVGKQILDHDNGRIAVPGPMNLDGNATRLG